MLSNIKEVGEKITHFYALCEAVERARELAENKPCHRNAVLLQRARRQRDEFRATLPKLRLVA